MHTLHIRICISFLSPQLIGHPQYKVLRVFAVYFFFGYNGPKFINHPFLQKKRNIKICAARKYLVKIRIAEKVGLKKDAT